MNSHEASGSESELERLVRVDEIVTAAVERARRGGEVDIDAIASEHPEVEAKLRVALRAVASLERSMDLSGRDGIAIETPARIGPYDVVREIGRGGMGVVYEAEDRSLERRVALKLLARRMSERPSWVERFRREAHAAARLEHPNVVPVYGVGDADGQHYFVMKYVDGYGLDGLVELLRSSSDGPGTDSSWSDDSDGGRRRRFALAVAQGRLERLAQRVDESSEHADEESGVQEPPTLGRAYHRNVARIGLRVADALGYAHARGVLHRDVKPANVLIDRRGQVWVADFGLAKLDEAEDLTREGDLVGTLRYMAPEQFQGHAEQRSDVFALGLVLYELLTLRRAFKGESRAQLVHELLYEEPASPHLVRSEVPQDLARIVMKAIAKLPEHRYRSAEALGADLRAFLDGQPIAARAPSTLYLARLAVNRNVKSFAAVVTLFVALVLGALLYVVQLRDSAQAESRLAYRARLAAAGSALQTADSIAARTRLDACPETLRGWEWSHLDASVDQSVRTIAGVGVPVERLEFEGGKMVVAHRGGVTTLMGDAVLQQVEFPGSDRRVPVVMGAWAVGDEWVSLDFGSGLWRCPAEGRPGGTAPQPEDEGHGAFRNVPSLRFIEAAAMTSDRDRLVVVEREGQVFVVDVEAFEIVRSAQAGQSRVTRAVMGPKDRLCYVSSTDGRVSAWDLETLESRVLFEGDAAVRSLAVDPKTGTLAIGCDDHAVHLVSRNGERLGRLLGHRGAVTAVAFSPDGTRVASACSGLELRIWNAATAGHLQSFTGASRITNQIAFAPDGRTLFTANVAGDIKEWFVDASGGRALIQGHLADIVALGHSSDGERFASGARDGTIRVHDADSLRLDLLIAGHGHELRGLIWHGDDDRILGVDRSGHVMDWSVPGCELRWRKTVRGRAGTPLRIAQERAVLTSYSGDVWIVDLEDGEVLQSAAFDEWGCRCAVISADEERLYVGTRVGHLLELDGRSLELLRTVENVHEGDLTALIIDHRRGTLVTAGLDGSIAFLDGESLAIERRMRPGGDNENWISDGLESLALSPDGETLAVGTHNWLVKLVDPDDGEVMLDLTGHTDWVRRLAFSPDGQTLLSTGSEGAVRVWDTRTTAERVTAIEERLDLEEVARLRVEARLGGALMDPGQAMDQLALLGEGQGSGHLGLERAERAVLHGLLAQDLPRSMERWIARGEDELKARCALQYVKGWGKRLGMTYGVHRLNALSNLALGRPSQAGAALEAAARLQPSLAERDPVWAAARAWLASLRSEGDEVIRLTSTVVLSEARDGIDRRTAGLILERIRAAR